MQLRDYQDAAVGDCIPLLERGCILVLPTGAGKTVTAVDLIRRASQRTLFVVHRREIVLQAAGALEEAGADVGLILAGKPKRPYAPMQVASVQTLRGKPFPDADLLVIDECHHATRTSPLYAPLVAHYTRRLGLTATPFRLDGKGLREAGFNELVVGAWADDLCARGVLHEPLVYAAPGPDMSSARKVAGDYSKGDLAAIAQQDGLQGKVVETWLKRANSKRTVVFAVDVDHAEDLEARFKAAGVAAETVTGATAKPQREAMLARLAAGVTTVLCNVGVLTEGWDLPALEVASVARPTASLCLHLQMLGRIMRACEGKDGAIVLDHAGNYHRHGVVTERLVYSLDGKVKKAPGVGPTKNCPQCGRVIAAGCKTCPECGYVFPPKEAPAETESELLPVGHRDGFEQRAARWKRFYEKAARICAWQNGSGLFHGDRVKVLSIAGSMFRARYGHYPLAYDHRLLLPSTASTYDWEQMRERWRAIAKKRGLDDRRTAFFVHRCEAEAREAEAKSTRTLTPAAPPRDVLFEPEGCTCSAPNARPPCPWCERRGEERSEAAAAPIAS